MNKVFYVFKDGTKTSSYEEAQSLVDSKGRFEMNFEWVELKETDESLILANKTKSSKPIKSNNRN